MYRKTDEVEAVFKRSKGEGFTHSSVGHTAYNNEKMIVVRKVIGRNAIENIVTYDKCHGFFRDARKIVMDGGEAATPSLWDEYVLWNQDSCDFPMIDATFKMKVLFNLNSVIFKALGASSPKLYLKLLCIALPVSNTYGVYKTDLIAESGWPVLTHVSAELLHAFTKPCRNEKVMDNIKKAREASIAEAKDCTPKKNAAGSTGATAAGPAVSPQAQVPVQPLIECDVTPAEHIDNFLAYLADVGVSKVVIVIIERLLHIAFFKNGMSLQFGGDARSFETFSSIRKALLP